MAQPPESGTGGDDWKAIEHGANIAITVAWQWSIATASQAERLSAGTGLARIPDAYLLVLAVRNVRRAAQMAVRQARTSEARSRIDSAIQAFDAELPGVSEIRDVLEHFDEYSQGVGDRQQPKLMRRLRLPDEALAEQYLIRLEGSSTNSASLTIRIGSHRIDLARASDAATSLVGEIWRALKVDGDGCCEV